MERSRRGSSSSCSGYRARRRGGGRFDRFDDDGNALPLPATPAAQFLVRGGGEAKGGRVGEGFGGELLAPVAREGDDAERAVGGFVGVGIRVVGEGGVGGGGGDGREFKDGASAWRGSVLPWWLERGDGEGGRGCWGRGGLAEEVQRNELLSDPGEQGGDDPGFLLLALHRNLLDDILGLHPARARRVWALTLWNVSLARTVGLGRQADGIRWVAGE